MHLYEPLSKVNGMSKNINSSEIPNQLENKDADPIYLLHQFGIVFIIILTFAILFFACIIRSRIIKKGQNKEPALPGNYECVLTKYKNQSGNEDYSFDITSKTRLSRGISEISEVNRFSALYVYNTFNTFKKPCPTLPKKVYKSGKTKVDERNVESIASVKSESGSVQFHIYAEPDLVLGRGLKERLRLLNSNPEFSAKVQNDLEVYQNKICERELRILSPEYTLKGHECYETLRPVSKERHYEQLTLIRETSVRKDENNSCYITPIS
jgi:hypothetical protein